MGKRRIHKNKNKQQEVQNKEEKWERKDMGEGFFIKYGERANSDAENKLCRKDGESITEIKMLTDKLGCFIDFPGVTDGEWRKKLICGMSERIRYYYHVGEFWQGAALFSWTVQPDGRYEEDENGFGKENYEEVTLYSYLNKKGEFITPFADFHPGKQRESLEMFKNRTTGFMENSMPEGHELWVSSGVKQKVDQYGHYKPFYGNTVVFPLEDEMRNYVENIQKKLEDIRRDFENCQQEAYLADSLEKDTYHITLHDLTFSIDKEEAEEKIKATKAGALRILEKLKSMDLPVIKMEPAYLFAMNGTSLVLGFQAIDEENQNNLNMLYEMFQTIVELPYPLTPHVTLSYFRYGKHNKYKIQGLRNIFKEVNAQIKKDQSSGNNPIVQLDVKNLVYQHFSSMNKYDTIQ